MSIVRPVLTHLKLWSPQAENLLLGTAAHESKMGTNLVQQGGPALGIFQMEPATHDDCWNNYLAYRNDLAAKAVELCAHKMERREQLVWNLYYATAMCRLQYNRFKEPLREADDVGALARYWKRYWNTDQGKGTVEQFMEHYALYVGG